MAIPSVQEIKDVLEGFCGLDLISDQFIEDRRDNEVIPFVNSMARTSVSGVKTAVEYYSGTGRDILVLNRRNVTAITAIRLVSGNDIDTTINIASLELISEEGVLKVKSGLSEYYNYRIFPKGNDNIKVTYTYGGVCPDDIGEAIKKLTAVLMLDNLEGRTGGGQLTAQNYNRQYGNMGKYSNIRKRLSNQAMAILKRYGSFVVGA